MDCIHPLLQYHFACRRIVLRSNNVTGGNTSVQKRSTRHQFVIKLAWIIVSASAVSKWCCVSCICVFLVIIPRGRRKQVRTHLVRPHRIPQDANSTGRPPQTRTQGSSSAGAPTRRPDARQPAASRQQRERQPPPVDAHQMHVEIDESEPPPVRLGWFRIN